VIPADSQPSPEVINARRGGKEHPTLDEKVVRLGLSGQASDSDPKPVLEEIEAELDPLVFERAVEELTHNPRLRDWLGVGLIDVLLRRAKPTTDVKSEYTAATALIAAFTLLLPEDLEGRRLDAAIVLRDPPKSVNSTWAQAAAQSAATAYAYWDDANLREALLRSLRGLRSVPAAWGDAEVELGHVHLLNAVLATKRVDLEQALVDAESSFSAVARAEEERADAGVMANVVAAVRGFGMGGDPSTVARDANAALRFWRDRAMYGKPNGIPVGARRATEALWGKLVSTLADLANSLDTPIWIRGADAIQLLLDVVESAAAVTLRPASEGGAERLVLPRIEGSLARNLGQRLILEAVLDGEELHGPRRASALALLRSANESSGKDGATVEDVLGPQVRELEALLGPKAFDEFRRRAEALLTVKTNKSRDAQWLEAYETTLEALEGNPDFESDRREEISTLVGDLLDFIKRCLQAQLNFGDGLFSYLGDPNAHESSMADHLRIHLEDAADWSVTSEVPQEGAGGRVDLRIAMGADRFVIECKRDHEPVTAESTGRYLAQTERYLGASLRIAGLVILDLTPKDTGAAPSLDRSVWVSDIPSPLDRPGPARKVVCMVVPGNRAATPSEIGRRAPRSPR
jgi:hypothetical protein